MKVCLHQTQQSSCILGGLTVSVDGMPRPQHSTQTNPWPCKLNHSLLSQKQQQQKSEKRKNPRGFVWLEILFFLFFFWTLEVEGLQLPEFVWVEDVSHTFGIQKIMEIGSVLKDTQWLHKHLPAAEQEVLLCWTFCLSFIFPFHKYRLETSPWKAEGNLVDCKHRGEEELFRMVKRV